MKRLFNPLRHRFPLISDSYDHRNVGIILKLLNVNAVAQNVVTNYKGPTIAVEDDPLLRDVKLPVKTDRTKLVSSE